jgi:hypothetical protein
MRSEHRFIICNHHSFITCNSPQVEYARILIICASPERETRRDPMPPVRTEFRTDSAQVCPKAILLERVPARIST